MAAPTSASLWYPVAVSICRNPAASVSSTIPWVTSGWCPFSAYLTPHHGAKARIESIQWSRPCTRSGVPYDLCMKRITISVPNEVAEKAQRAAEAGDVANVSAYFTRLAQREPDWASARAIVAEMVAQAGGVTDDDIAWAESTLGIRQELLAA